MVVLISGSMRMAVEAIEDETVSVVWCHEGKVGRDNFPAALLNKWENRGGDERGGFGGRGGDRGGFGGRGGFNKGGDRGHGGGGWNKGGDRDGGDRGGWKGRDNDRGGDRGGWNNDRGGDRRGGWDDRGGKRGGWDNDRDRGYDGRPREKKYFRKGGDDE